MSEVVAVLGATPQEDRYVNRAVKLLLAKGYTVVPVNPRYTEVEGIRCYPSFSGYAGTIDTVTVYVNSQTALASSNDIISAKPKRVILNPGTEHPLLKQRLADAGINVIEGCTIVMLNTGQF